MRVEQLIEMLGQANPALPVKFFNPDTHKAEEVSGMTYANSGGYVELFNDKP